MNTAIRRQVPHHMTVDEFIAWVGDDRWQLLDGEPRASQRNARNHPGERRLHFDSSFARSGSPCRAVTEPAIIPRVRARSNMRVR